MVNLAFRKEFTCWRYEQTVLSTDHIDTTAFFVGGYPHLEASAYISNEDHVIVELNYIYMFTSCLNVVFWIIKEDKNISKGKFNIFF